NKVAWLDVGGSGIETLAHLKENGRMTVMFCAFDGSALILRLFGKGEAVQFDDPRFPELLAHFPDFGKARAIMVMDVSRIQDSCGWGVPFMDFREERDQLKRYANNPKVSADQWAEAFYSENATSIDGLTGMERPE
ncbi:MAG: pyridoxamine 5'-phosphate oxidase family protein, partial [Pseudomonadota bacterium]